MLIGITGLATSGKTTVANALIEKHKFHKIAFADPMKSMLNAIGVDREYTHGSKKEEPCELLCGKTGRFVMQTLGTEFGRNIIGEDFWVRVWENAYHHAMAVVSDVVVDDVRFPNEVFKIRELGGVILRVTRPGVKKGTHASETHELPWDFRVQNDGSVDDLDHRIVFLLRSLKGTSS